MILSFLASNFLSVQGRDLGVNLLLATATVCVFLFIVHKLPLPGVVFRAAGFLALLAWIVVVWLLIGRYIWSLLP